MKSKDLNQLVSVYKKQLQKGDIQAAYTQLVKYIQKLKTHFSRELKSSYTCGNILQGYMDYTYFYLSNSYLNKSKLKLGLVLNHEKIRFELWLLGQTRDIQEKYWHLLRKTKWITQSEIPLYSIFEVVLVDEPDFSDLDLLTVKIQQSLTAVSSEIIATLKTLK
ncbi:MAG: hypothetical protein OEZ39_16430 [Gammaproteobacteria bacterium]|nr:hypothetical protein [Gammaproteobacteria bacterium]MDH5653447.1 hypothetical protein [Gammaproteobacteria bacterium]